jgi:glycosyltransferase involved in cell wall biosynthesis
VVNKMEAAQVLVVMPVYNARSYVSAAIESILNQTYPFYKILIINDGSTDGSEQIIKSYLNREVILWHQKNQGPGAAMNRAIQYAHDLDFKFIARIDADDISLSNRLEKQIALLLRFPNSAACSANCYYIDSVSEKIIGSSTVSASQKLIKWEIANGLRGLIQGVTLFRTSALFSMGGYREQFKLAEETDLFLRLAENFELCNSSAYLAKIRLYPNSLSMSNVRKNIHYQFYALDCRKKRENQNPERGFEDFINNMSWGTKLAIWHEECFLKLWRNQLSGGNILVLLMASIFDPRRAIVRLLRKFDDRESQTNEKSI